MIGIYKITSPSGKIYIGQSQQVEKRKEHYRKNSHRIPQPKLRNSFEKYGVDNHRFEVIEECSITDLNDRERHWQEHYQVLDKGLNCVYTETDTKRRVMSEDTKAKIGDANRGRIMSVEEIEKRRQIAIKNGNRPPSAKGRKITSETKRKMSEAAKDRKYSDAVKRERANWMTGSKLMHHPEELVTIRVRKDDIEMYLKNNYKFGKAK